MPTHDYVIDNQTAPNFRSDLNNALAAIVTQNSNATAPSVTYANMFWYETDTNTLWKRDEANSAWISMGVFDESLGTFTPSGQPPQGSVDFLGSIGTTSGSSVTLSGLTLTSYKQLQFVVDSVSGSASSSELRLNGKLVSDATVLAAGDFCLGGGNVDLASGVFWYSGALVYNAGAASANRSSGGASGLTTASTSITFTISAGNFDAGSIRISG